MSDQPDDELTDNRIIRAIFPGANPNVIARVREISEADSLSTDPQSLADDLQTVACLALVVHERVEILIQLLQ